MSGHREHALVGLDEAEGRALETMGRVIDAAEVRIVDALEASTQLSGDRLREVLTRALVVDLAATVIANGETGLDAGDIEEIIVWLRHAHLNMAAKLPAPTPAAAP